MTTRNGIIILVVIAVIVIGILVLYSRMPEGFQLPSGEKKITPPAATGNVDDLVNAMLKEISDEDTVLKTGEGDTALITTDSQEIGNFGQSIQESEL